MNTYLFLEQPPQRLLIASGQRFGPVGIDLPVVRLQEVEQMAQEQQTLPRRVSRQEQQTHKRVQLAHTQRLTLLDFLLSLVTEMKPTQTTVGEFSFTLDGGLDISPDRRVIDKSFLFHKKN